jgi:hypothetical protein
MKNSNITIFAILLLVAATGCVKEKYVKPMSDAAYATADRVCGVYRLVAMDWSGEPVDLDGDGIAQESLWEECLAGEHLGLLVPENHIIEWTLRPIYSYDAPGNLGFPFFHGDYTPGVESLSYYSLHLISGEMRIFEDGTLDLQVPAYQEESSHWGVDNEECAIRDITVSWEPDGDFLVAGTTSFRDERTGESIEGRETLRYHCVSTKEKKKR